MFDICFSTPPVMNEDGFPQAGAQLRLGNDIFVFTIDLRHWTIPEWRVNLTDIFAAAKKIA